VTFKGFAAGYAQTHKSFFAAGAFTRFGVLRSKASAKSYGADANNPASTYSMNNNNHGMF